MSVDSPPHAPNTTSESEESMELPIFACGTWAPGHVHDPCQHSLVRVLCCIHAGCMREYWDCGEPTRRENWLKYQAIRLTQPAYLARWAFAAFVMIFVWALLTGWVDLLWLFTQLAVVVVLVVLLSAVGIALRLL